MIGPRLAITEMEFHGIFSNADWTFFQRSDLSYLKTYARNIYRSSKNRRIEMKMPFPFLRKAKFHFENYTRVYNFVIFSIFSVAKMGKQQFF